MQQVEAFFFNRVVLLIQYVVRCRLIVNSFYNDLKGDVSHQKRIIPQQKTAFVMELRTISNAYKTNSISVCRNLIPDNIGIH